MQKYTLYIGANNITKEVDYKTMQDVLDEYFQGYTIVESLGVWEGKQEKSCTVTLFIDWEKKAMVPVIKELCVALSQYCILLEVDSVGELIEA